VQPRINIVILNWNGYDDTYQLLESLLKITYPNYKIIVVDNNSVSDEAERLRKNFMDKVHTIQCEKNLGFSGGNNIGIKYSLEEKADFILLLNNDTTVEVNFLEPLVNKFYSSKQIGITAPQINYFSEPGIIWSAGGKISRIRSSGFAKSNFNETIFDKRDKSVSFVSGCCMLIKSEVINKTGLFDENYFLYNEDTDFCLRTIRVGYDIFIIPKSKIYHKVNSSTEKNLSHLPLYYTTRNRLYLAKKFFSKTFTLTFIYIALSMALKSLFWILIGKWKNITVVKNAIKDFLEGKMGMIYQNNFKSKL
jgi:GT2 family glycosyltransferase